MSTNELFVAEATSKVSLISTQRRIKDDAARRSSITVVGPEKKNPPQVPGKPKIDSVVANTRSEIAGNSMALSVVVPAHIVATCS